MFVGGNLVSWKSKKQSVVARSTTKAEYRAIVVGVAEMLWMRTHLVELKVNKNNKMMLWCYNKSAINIANSSVQHDRMKNIEIDRFFIKEKLDNGILKLNYVSTEHQVAHCLTKGLGPVSLTRLCDKMGLVDIFPPS